MAVFVRSDSKATIRKTFGIAGDAYLEITRGTAEPLDWEYAVLTVESDRSTSDTLSEMIEEVRAKVMPVIDDAHKAILMSYAYGSGQGLAGSRQGGAAAAGKSEFHYR
jgi:phospholipid/cholesterol/gamma-HCH transport system substrate-binding protein